MTNIEVGDIVICNDLIGIVVAMNNKDLTIRCRDNSYRIISKNSTGLALVCNAYAHCALFYEKLFGGK